MQSLLYLNLLLLILILVLCISSISFSYTDLDSSKSLHSVTASDLANLSISKVLFRTILYSEPYLMLTSTVLRKNLGNILVLILQTISTSGIYTWKGKQIQS